MRILILLIVLINFIFAQQVDDDELKCYHAKTAGEFLVKSYKIAETQNYYDVTFYDIDLTIDPVSEIVNGIVGIKGISLVESLDKIEINLSNALDIESVKDEQGNEQNIEHQSDLLTIFLDSSLNLGDVFYYTVKYSGHPQSAGLGSFGFDRYNSEPMIWSLSEPYGARNWWPCKDTPKDKADSVNISITVPSDLVAASNGKLVDTIVNGDTTTYYWEERYPIATYLVSIAVYPYTVFYDWYKYSETDSMRLEYYVFPDQYTRVYDNYKLTKDMIAGLAQRFGEYPFINEKYGHAQFVWGGGMEHQTLTSLGGYSEALIVHELGHQWWGDMVTCANFHHIWLNEGFATYSEALWYEIRDNDVQSLHLDMAANKTAYNWQLGSIYVEDTTSVSRIFDYSLTYAKASWILHMLRHIVGDEDFFSGVQEYGERYRFKSAVTEQFQEVTEEVSGKDLDYFFQRWIYGELYPIYEVFYQQSLNELIVQINQIQTSDVFKMPIDLVIYYDDGSNESTVIHNSIREETFTIQIENGKVIEKIEIDPNEWILRKISSVTRIDLDDLETVKNLKLYPVYPNPFNTELSIKLYTRYFSNITISVFDINGKLIWKKKQPFTSGTHIVNWNGIDIFGNEIVSGTYIIEAKNDGLVRSQKALYIK